MDLTTSLSCIGEGNGNPLQCSCLENPRGGGAWWAAVYGVAQSRTRRKWLSSSSSISVLTNNHFFFLILFFFFASLTQWLFSELYIHWSLFLLDLFCCWTPLLKFSIYLLHFPVLQFFFGNFISSTSLLYRTWGIIILTTDDEWMCWFLSSSLNCLYWCGFKNPTLMTKHFKFSETKDVVTIVEDSVSITWSEMFQFVKCVLGCLRDPH